MATAAIVGLRAMAAAVAAIAAVRIARRVVEAVIHPVEAAGTPAVEVTNKSGKGTTFSHALLNGFLRY